MPDGPPYDPPDEPARLVRLPAVAGDRAAMDIRRHRAADRREQSAQTRLRAADYRDAVARARDLAALTRDQASEARNLALARRNADDQHDAARPVTGSEVIVLAAGKRKRAARRRAQAFEQDARAADDRRSAAQDREHAAYERLHALVDRELLADALALTTVDPVTGARARAAGLAELDREVARCSRTSGLLAVAYVDVVGLKALNDSAGHGAGDELLRRVVALVKAHLRSYDLVIRVGGDEFVCAMSDMSVPDARERFREVAATLASAPDVGAIRTGFAQLAPGESVSELIARADRELIDGPHAHH
jgi:diguanylate cyclase (GGDEF)-like protein